MKRVWKVREVFSSEEAEGWLNELQGKYPSLRLESVTPSGGRWHMLVVCYDHYDSDPEGRLPSTRGA